MAVWRVAKMRHQRENGESEWRGGGIWR